MRVRVRVRCDRCGSGGVVTMNGGSDVSERDSHNKVEQRQVEQAEQVPTGGASADRLEVPCFRVPLPSRNVDNRAFADGFIVRALSDGLLCPEMPYIALEMPPGAQLFFYCYKPGHSQGLEQMWRSGRIDPKHKYLA